jgi:xanthosine utilization system XapX-like protein
LYIYYLFTAVVATGVIYGLWWLHNPQPFAAALIAGLCVAVYDTYAISYRRTHVLRMEMLEERVEELEANEDALYD